MVHFLDRWSLWAVPTLGCWSWILQGSRLSEPWTANQLPAHSPWPLYLLLASSGLISSMMDCYMELWMKKPLTLTLVLVTVFYYGKRNSRTGHDMVVKQRVWVYTNVSAMFICVQQKNHKDCCLKFVLCCSCTSSSSVCGAKLISMSFLIFV